MTPTTAGLHHRPGAATELDTPKIQEEHVGLFRRGRHARSDPPDERRRSRRRRRRASAPAEIGGETGGETSGETSGETGPAHHHGDEEASGHPSPVFSIDSRSFFAETARGYTIVDFWAAWCGPCHQLAPIFEELAREYEGRVRFAKLDVDQSPDISGMLQIRSIPTLVVFDPEGNEAARFSGIPARRDLTGLLDQLAARS